MAGRARIARAGTRRSSGQHFLRSNRLAATIVDAAGVGRGELVVDVGAGYGILTGELARRGARVVALEVDAVLAGELGRRFERAGNVSVVQGDVLRHSWPSEPFAVVANLPFGISAAVLRSLLDDPSVPLRAAHVILQWEAAAKRAAVWPSTLASVFWGAWYELRLAKRLPPEAFAPPPRVDAGLLGIVRRPDPLIPAREHAAYGAFLRAGFARGSPRGLVPPRRLKQLATELGFAPHANSRDLDAAQWTALYVASARCGRLPRGRTPLTRSREAGKESA